MNISFPLIFDLDTNTILSSESIEVGNTDASILITIYDPSQYLTLNFKQGDGDVEFTPGSIEPFSNMMVNDIDWTYTSNQTTGFSDEIDENGVRYKNPGAKVIETWTNNIDQHPSTSSETNLHSIIIQLIADHYFDSPLSTFVINNHSNIADSVEYLLTSIKSSWTSTGTTTPLNNTLLAKRSIMAQYIDAVGLSSRIHANEDGSSTYRFQSGDSVEFLVYMKNSIERENNARLYGTNLDSFMPPCKVDFMFNFGSMTNCVKFTSNDSHIFAATHSGFRVYVVGDTKATSPQVAQYNTVSYKLVVLNRMDDMVCLHTSSSVEIVQRVGNDNSSSWIEYDTIPYKVGMTQFIDYDENILFCRDGDLYIYNIPSKTISLQYDGTYYIKLFKVIGNSIYCMCDTVITVVMNLQTFTIDTTIEHSEDSGNWVATKFDVSPEYFIVHNTNSTISSSITQVVDLSTMQVIYTIPLPPVSKYYVSTLTIDPNLRWFAISYRYSVYIYNIDNGTLNTTIDLAKISVQYSNSGNHLLASLYLHSVDNGDLFEINNTDQYQNFEKTLKLKVKMN
jgi:hypothetical protein